MNSNYEFIVATLPLSLLVISPINQGQMFAFYRSLLKLTLASSPPAIPHRTPSHRATIHPIERGLSIAPLSAEALT